VAVKSASSAKPMHIPLASSRDLNGAKTTPMYQCINLSIPFHHSLVNPSIPALVPSKPSLPFEFANLAVKNRCSRLSIVFEFCQRQSAVRRKNDEGIKDEKTLSTDATRILGLRETINRHLRTAVLNPNIKKSYLSQRTTEFPALLRIPSLFKMLVL
jgi:hypothetical protein